MSRRVRYLRANRANRKPGIHVVVDTETRSEPCMGPGDARQHWFRLGHAFSFRWDGGRARAEKELAFTDLAAWWDWLAGQVSKQRTTWVWAHNAGFDFTVLRGWEVIQRQQLQWTTYIDQGPPWALRGHLHGCPVVFIDSMNWFHCSLERLGESVGVRKGELPGADDGDGALAAYCANDVHVLTAAVQKLLAFHRDHDLGNLRYTVASQALQLWRHRLGPRVPANHLPPLTASQLIYGREERIYPLPHGCEDALDVEAKSYFGPAAESFRAGPVDGPVYHLDAQSFYPSVMRGRKYPVRLLDRLRCPSPASLARALRAFEGVALVELESWDYAYPLRKEDGPVRSWGRFQTALAGPELRKALADGCVRHVFLAYLYEGRDVFTQYVDELTGLRAHYQAAGDHAWADLAKALSVSLYGKFVQKEAPWVEAEGVISSEPWGRFVVLEEVGQQAPGDKPPPRGRPPRPPGAGRFRPVTHRAIAWKPQRQGEKGWADHACPLVGAYVCSYARLRMDEFRRVAGEQNTFYIFSDCLHVNQAGHDALLAAGLVEEGAVGKLRLVATYASVRYFGPNRYLADDTPVAAGIGRKARRRGPLAWEVDQFQSTKEIIEAEPDGSVIVRRQLVELSESPRFGTAAAGGWLWPHVEGVEGPPRPPEPTRRKRKGAPVPF